MPDLSRGTALVMPTQGYATQDYEQAKFIVTGGSIVSVRTNLASDGTQTGTANPLPVTLASLIAGENLTANVLGVQQKPVADSAYAPSEFTSFGAAAGTGAVVKPSAGNVFSVHVTNSGTGLRYFQMFNSITAVANGATPVASYPLAGGAAAIPTTLSLDSSHFAPSRYFGTGIAIAISSTNGTLGTASVTASEHNIHIKYA